MKKLFFAAALAVVAIGGALSSKATVYQGVSGQLYNCNTTGTLCSTIPENIRVQGSTGQYLSPSSFNFTPTQKFVLQ